MKKKIGSLSQPRHAQIVASLVEEGWPKKRGALTKVARKFGVGPWAINRFLAARERFGYCPTCHRPWRANPNREVGKK